MTLRSRHGVAAVAKRSAGRGAAMDKRSVRRAVGVDTPSPRSPAATTRDRNGGAPAAMRRRRAAAACVLAALAALLLAPGASAHAEPFRSEPPGGARLEAAPETVWVDFTEPVFRDGSWIRVVDQDGQRVDEDDLRITGDQRPRMEIGLQQIPDGAYSIQWQTYSKSDGHTIRGSIGFAVGGFAPPTTTTDAEAEFDTFPAAARAVLYAGIALGVGAMAFARFVARLPARDFAPFLVAASGLAVVGTALLFVDTWRGTGLGLGDYVRSPGGTAFAWRLGVIAAVAAWTGAWWTWPRMGYAPAVTGWAVFTWLTASFGHVTQEGAWAVALEWLHLIAAGAWIGGLFVYLVHMGVDAQRRGARFSRLAFWASMTVVASGSAITAVLVWHVAASDPARLLSDSWLWFLAAKVGLVGVMLLLAAVNRYVFLGGDNILARAASRLRPDWTATGDARARALRQAVKVESSVSALVIVAAGLLLSVSPPSDDVIEQAAGLERTAQGRDFNALMQMTPSPELGQSHELRFFITEADSGEPLRNNSCGRDDCLQVRWTVDDDPSSEQAEALLAEGDGWWRLDDALFTRPGNTTVTLDVQSAYVYLDELRFEPFAVT